MKVEVIRYGHRIVRDKRITTHCCLVARAFGADGIVICGDEDNSILEGMEKINKNWGGNFSISHRKNWKDAVENLKAKGYSIVHLTMYGLPIQQNIGKIRKKDKVALFIGSQKVPPEIYGIADFNIAVTNQPHSEVAALAIFLDWLFDGKELNKEFAGAKVKIVPGQKEVFAKHSISRV